LNCGILTLSTTSAPNASLVETILAPELIYASSVMDAYRPAPD